MSHAPNDTPPWTQSAPASTPPSASAPTGAPAARPHLSIFLKVSIALLAALSFATIAFVFMGDFEGKAERITATFVVFAVFVGLTALDTTLGKRNSWYAPVALIANSYILAVLLLITWMHPGVYYLGGEIFGKGLLVVAVTRAVVGCCQLLLGMGEGKPDTLTRFAFATSVAAAVSGILFTAPMVVEVFGVEVPELYWKIAVAVLLITGLGLAITLLVRWSYGSDERDAKRAARVAQAQSAARFPVPGQPAPMHGQAPVQPFGTGFAASSPQAQAAPFASQAPAAPFAPQAQAAPFATQIRPLPTWPTFADGRPLPARADGQPDFTVPGAPRPPQ